MFERLANFRDITDGRVLRPGVVFRSAELSRITERDRATLQRLGIGLICDLRAPKQRRARVSIETVQIPLAHERRRELLTLLWHADGGHRVRDFNRRYYRALAFGHPGRIRELFELLAGRSTPVLIHCTAGKDRTGFAVALLQLLAGVPYDAVRRDYLATNDAYAAQLARVTRVVRIATLARVSRDRIHGILKAHPEVLDEVHAAIVDRHGSIERYLREGCGVDAATLDALRRRLRA